MKSCISSSAAIVTSLILIASLSACTTSLPTDVQPEVDPSIQTRAAPTPPSNGAINTGAYRNLFKEWNSGLSAAQIQGKLNTAWDHFFVSTDNNKRVYYPAGSNGNGTLAYILDTGNNDVRSEGMSYGMMISVQMDKKTNFNAIWNWAKTNMQHSSGSSKGYFAWHCQTNGSKLDNNPAPDGEEYFAMSLFFAAGRWGNGTGIYNYQAEANNILNTMLHKEDMNGGVVNGVTNMFNQFNQVVFVPNTGGGVNGFTDPSYHVPAFYDLFSRWAAGYNNQRQTDRNHWATIAGGSRNYLFGQALNATTGLSPDYAEFNGVPKSLNSGDGHNNYAYDAWRVGMNWGVDYAWFANQSLEKTWADRLQTFMDNQGTNSFKNVYTLSGTPLDTNHDSGHLAMLATAGLAATNARAYNFVSALWSAPIPTGTYRYYSGLLYFMGLLNNAGQYKIYKPGGV
jgi:oligosaccharide reducing-end xylanase